ncbi:hypothetical protein QBC46DRAFT_460016 [Diplogelasinospora grovesii]|uniref:Uncharacterized protein n=1 Tax=Diplogelasinospora grovesii TaxID=303347 RepID=A0AAN6N472_9PEZI|nr:hypothetical protein QBC46DRAFT_460016 [Diplogelasinospora grovesii]
MEESTPAIPRVLQQPPSVDFIENRLPERHEAFKNLQVRYDPALDKFVPLGSAVVMPPAQQGLLSSTGADVRMQHLTVRKLAPGAGAMAFWNKILERAMMKLKNGNPEDGTKSAFLGRVKKGYRYLADHSHVIKQVVEVVPDSLAYASPVKTALKILLDVVQTASDLRKLVRDTFDGDGIEESFTRVEIFLAAFPGDEYIEEASVDLIACILKAVEEGIAYFISSLIKRWHYGRQQDLVDSISEIPSKTEYLIKIAHESNIVGTQRGLSLLVEAIEQVVLVEVEADNKTRSLLHTRLIAKKTDLIFGQGKEILMRVDESNAEILLQLQSAVAGITSTVDKSIEQVIQRIDKFGADLVNNIKGILDDAAKQKNLEDARWYEIMAEQQKLLPFNSPYQQQQLPWYPSQQHIANSHLQQPPFDIYHHQYYYSIQQQQQPPPPLSPYHQYQHQHQESSPPLITVQALLAALSTSDSLDRIDITSILSSTESISHRYRARARAIVRTTQDDDPCRSGGAAILRSFVAQLLEQAYQGYTFNSSDVDLGGVESGDLQVLSALFEWLVRSLPPGGKKTLVCVVDGVGSYENATFEQGMVAVLDMLLGLARSQDLNTPVKILATSPTGTVSVDKLFKRDDSSLLLMERLEGVGDGVGMVEELGDQL